MLRMHYRMMSDGTARYAVSGIYRWIYGLFCLFVGMGFVSVLGDGGFSPSALVPLSLFVVSLVGFGYRERWSFDPGTRMITYGIGCFVWFKRLQFHADTVQRVEINHFVRGRSPHESNARPRGRNKAMLVFTLRMQDDTNKDIEILAEHQSNGKTEAAAQAVAALMDLPFFADREPDTIRPIGVRDL